MIYTREWPLRIPQELAESIAKEDLSILMAVPETDLEFLELMANKIWRLNNFYHIVDKKGIKCLFTMNLAQLKLYRAHKIHPRDIVLKSRQQGISTYELIDAFDDSIFKDDFTGGLMAQGKRESGILLQRSKLLWKEFPQQVKNFLAMKPSQDNTEAIKFSNGSTLLIGVSFRSQTLQRLHVSELGKIAAENPKRVEETFTGSLQALAAGNPACLESTAEGDNEFKTVWDKAVILLDEALRLYPNLSEEEAVRKHFGPKDFYPLFLSWSDDPDCTLANYQADTEESIRYFEELEELYGFIPTEQQRWWWISQYRELEGKIYQEYPFNPEEAFKASIESAFWSALWRDCGVVYTDGKEGSRRLPDGSTIEWAAGTYDYDERLPVYCVQDLGINDYNTIIMFQRYQGVYRVVGEYWNNNKAVLHYMGWIKDWCAAKDIGWKEVGIYLPHDSTKRAQTDLRTVIDMYEDDGWDVNLLERPSDKLGAINAVRWEVEQQRIVVEAMCSYVRKTMQNYRREFDTVLEVWKNTPRHDEWSHMADAIIYMVMSDAPDVGEITYGKVSRSAGV